MTTSRVAAELAAVLVPLGFFGAALAAVCATVAAIAVIRGAGGLCGGAVGVWIPCAMLSSTASFASQWLPLIIAGASLVGMLVIGGVVRAILGSAQTPKTARAAEKTVVVGQAVTTGTATVPSGRALSQSTA